MNKLKSIIKPRWFGVAILAQLVLICSLLFFYYSAFKWFTKINNSFKNINNNLDNMLIELEISNTKLDNSFKKINNTLDKRQEEIK